MLKKKSFYSLLDENKRFKFFIVNLRNLIKYYNYKAPKKEEIQIKHYIFYRHRFGSAFQRIYKQNINKDSKLIIYEDLSPYNAVIRFRIISSIRDNISIMAINKKMIRSILKEEKCSFDKIFPIHHKNFKEELEIFSKKGHIEKNYYDYKQIRYGVYDDK